MRIFVSLCAACLMAGAAWAQQANPDNPHSTMNKDRQGSDVPQSVTNAQTQTAEQPNVHSVRNKDKAPAPNPSNAQIQAAESEHPESLANKDRDHDMMMTNATPQMQLEKLHMANLHEIEAGKLAEQNGTDKVKDYARTLQRDHQDADQKVMALAKKKGFSLQDKMMMHHEEKKDELAGKKGADFDKTFADMMVKGHDKVIHLAQMWKQDCKDKDVCALIDELMPKLQEHRQMAEKLRGPMAQGRAPTER